MPESLTRSRLDSFSDGVIAVIITIMVLELKVPTVREMSDRAALLSNARIFAIYLLSFMQTGIYWVNHHYLLDDLETVSHGVLWANLGLLFCLSLIPFGLEWIGVRGIGPVSVAVYAICFSAPALAWTVLSRVVSRRTHVPPAAGLLKQFVSSTLTVGAIFVAFWSPCTALAMMGFVALIWLVPPSRIVQKSRDLNAGTTSSAHSS